LSHVGASRDQRPWWFTITRRARASDTSPPYDCEMVSFCFVARAFLAQHHGAGLVSGEVGAGKSTAARVFTTTLNTSLYKILYVHFSSGSALDLLRQIALKLVLMMGNRILVVLNDGQVFAHDTRDKTIEPAFQFA